MKRVLDLGCGTRKTEGAVGVDQVALPGVDVVHDLARFPYPFEDDSFDEIILRHVVEHLPDIVTLMRELQRIAKPGARVSIATPHYTSLDSYTDPTHRHHFSLFTFDFFCGATVHEHTAGSRYRLIGRRVDFWPLFGDSGFRPHHFLGLKWIAERHPHLYERFLAFLFPMREFEVTLEVVK